MFQCVIKHLVFIRDNPISGSSLSFTGTICGARQCRYRPQSLLDKLSWFSCCTPKINLGYITGRTCLQHIHCRVLSPNHLLSCKAASSVPLLGPGQQNVLGISVFQREFLLKKIQLVQVNDIKMHVSLKDCYSTQGNNSLHLWFF